MAGEGSGRGEVREAEFANVHDVFFGEGEGVRGEVPGFELVSSHLDTGEVAYAGDFGLVLGHRTSGAKFFDFFFAREGGMGDGVGRIGGFGGSGGILDVREVELEVLWFRCAF